MKKLSVLIFVLTMAFSLCFGMTAYASGDKDEAVEIVSAAPAEPETTIDASQPRLMVTDYKVSGGSITPLKKSTLEITFKNFSQTKALRNIKLSISDESGEIETTGMPTAYVDRIYAGSTYVWKVEIVASNTAQIGKHTMTVSSEYEDKYYNAYSGSDAISVNVKQSVGLDYDGLCLSPKIVQGDTETVSVNLMNTGKTELRNCKIDFDINGLTTGGTLFIGEIPAGENKEGSSNLRASSDITGEVKGKATISYEDAYGKTYSEEVELSTIIEKKVVVEDTEEEKEQSKYPLWWLFLIAGAAVGGGVGCAIPIAITKSKQRKEDELRL